MPTALNEVVVVPFATVSAGDWIAVMVAVVVGDVASPDVPDAVFVTEPASTSACVVVYVPEHVMEAPGAKPPDGSAGHVTEAILLSETVAALVSVTLPLLVNL